MSHVYPWKLWIWYLNAAGEMVIDEIPCFSEEDALSRMEKLKQCQVERIMACRA